MFGSWKVIRKGKEKMLVKMVFSCLGTMRKDQGKKNQRKGLGWWWCPFSLTKNEES